MEENMISKNMKLERRAFKFRLDSLSEEGVFTGYASIFGVEDSYRDIVEAGAFKKTLRETKSYPCLWYHDPAEPIGIITAEEDSKGLLIRGEINMEVRRASEIRALMKQGAVKGLSIGFETVKAKVDEKNGTRTIKEIRLWEVSLVTFQACPGAEVSDVKSSFADDIDAALLVVADLDDRAWASEGQRPQVHKAIEKLMALVAAEPPTGTAPANDEPPDTAEASDLAEIKSSVEEVNAFLTLCTS
jgi:HK97 family phage prohead protease